MNNWNEKNDRNQEVKILSEIRSDLDSNYVEIENNHLSIEQKLSEIEKVLSLIEKKQFNRENNPLLYGYHKFGTGIF